MYLHLMTQLDGIGMMECEELGRKSRIVIHKDGTIRHIALAAGSSSQMMRAFNRKSCCALIDSLSDDRGDDMYELGE